MNTFLIIDRAGKVHRTTAIDVSFLPTELNELAATVIEIDGDRVVMHKALYQGRDLDARSPADTLDLLKLSAAQRRFGAGVGPFKLDRSHLDDVEHDIAPPMAMAITVPLDGDDVTMYLATSPFRARKSGEDHLIAVAQRVAAALERP